MAGNFPSDFSDYEPRNPLSHPGRADFFFLKIFRKIPGNLAEICRKRGQKSPIFAPGRRGGSDFRPSPGGKTDCKGLFWAVWVGLWRLLRSGNAGIPPATKTAVRGFLGLLGGCRKKSPLRLGSGAGCGCCCGGLGGAVRFGLGRGKAGTRAAGAWAILGSCGGHKKSPGAGAAPGLGGYLEIFSSSNRIASGRIRTHRKAILYTSNQNGAGVVPSSMKFHL